MKRLDRFPDYAVDENGDVYSFKNNKNWVKLTPQPHRRGYLTVNLTVNGKNQPVLVHRLVAEAFIPNPGSLPCVNHKNENKTDNRVENLEWCTHKYNSNYGTWRTKRSEQLKGSKLSQETIEKIATANRGQKRSDEAKKNISDALKNSEKLHEYFREHLCVGVVVKDSKTKLIMYRFPSIAEAARTLKCDRSTISKCCKGRLKTHHGFIWEYDS